MKASLVPFARIERAILVLRGHKVLLDADLAALYEVPTKVLLQAVKRNLERFPQDFMFQLLTQPGNSAHRFSPSPSGRGLG